MIDKLTQKRIGAKIAELRKKRGLSQRKLADETGIHHIHIARLEMGTLNPTVRTLTLLASRLGAYVDIIEDE